MNGLSFVQSKSMKSKLINSKQTHSHVKNYLCTYTSVLIIIRYIYICYEKVKTNDDTYHVNRKSKCNNNITIIRIYYLYIIIMYTINGYVLYRIYIGARYQHIPLELIVHYTHIFNILYNMYKYTCGTVGILIYL